MVHIGIELLFGGGVKDQFSNSFMVVFKNSEILVNKMKNKKYNTV
jgi:hypothetical protein